MKKLFTIFFVLLLTLCFTLNAFAVDEALDLNKKGTITVTFRCSHGFSGNGTATLYRVADTVWQDGQYTFAYTDAFNGCGFTLDNVDDKNAGKFASYATINGIKGQDIEIEDGVAVFENLPVGLYLILHEDNSDEFTDALPFFVTLPVSSDNAWSYNVDAAPKIEVKHIEISKPPSIPQTGQLKWPIPALAVAGVLVFALGWALYFRRNKEQ